MKGGRAQLRAFASLPVNNDHPNLWSLLTGGRCFVGKFMSQRLTLGLKNGGRCRQVAAIRRWSLAQV